MAQQDNSDLKRREYRDANGTVHHHTHLYMQEHSGHEERSRADDRASQSTSGERGGGHAARPLTHHEAIRRWAEERQAEPACVKGTGRGKGDVGMIRLDLPGYSGGDSLEHISWDDWFKAFDANGLALLVQETTASGEQSNFNKLVSRDSDDAHRRR